MKEKSIYPIYDQSYGGKKEIFEAEDKIKFENGRSYEIKFKRTKVLHFYEPVGDFYRVEYKTAKNHSIEGYISGKDLISRYTWFKNLGNGKAVVREIPQEEVEAAFEAYEILEKAEEAKKKAKYQMKK